MPRRYKADPSKGYFQVEWPLFGELSRALALKVAREYDPEIVVGIATAGVIPGAVIAAILDRDFRSILISRRNENSPVRQTPSVLGAGLVSGLVDHFSEPRSADSARRLPCLAPRNLASCRHGHSRCFGGRSEESPAINRCSNLSAAPT